MFTGEDRLQVFTSRKQIAPYRLIKKEVFMMGRNARPAQRRSLRKGSRPYRKQSGTSAVGGSDIVARKSEIGMDIDTHKDLLGAIRAKNNIKWGWWDE